MKKEFMHNYFSLIYTSGIKAARLDLKSGCIKVKSYT